MSPATFAKAFFAAKDEFRATKEARKDDPLDAFGKSVVADLKKIREVEPAAARELRINIQRNILEVLERYQID